MASKQHEDDMDERGYVPNPRVVKELHMTSLKQAYELIEAATTLGLGVQLNNYVGSDSEEEWWSLIIHEDLPLRGEGEERDGA